MIDFYLSNQIFQLTSKAFIASDLKSAVYILTKFLHIPTTLSYNQNLFINSYNRLITFLTHLLFNSSLLVLLRMN